MFPPLAILLQAVMFFHFARNKSRKGIDKLQNDRNYQRSYKKINICIK